MGKDEKKYGGKKKRTDRPSPTRRIESWGEKGRKGFGLELEWR